MGSAGGPATRTPAPWPSAGSSARVDRTPLGDLTDAELDAWRALARAASEPNPFLEADLVLAAARSLTAPPRVSLLSVRVGGELLLALPVVTAPVLRRLPVRCVRSWVHEYCFLGTPLVRSGHETRAWAALLSSLGAHRSHPALVLPLLPASGPVREGLDRALLAHPFAAHHLLNESRAVALRRPDGTVAPSPLRGVHRKGLRRQSRRLGEALGGTVELVDRTGDPAALQAFLDLEAAGWKGREGTALAARGDDAGLLTTLPESWLRDRVRVLSLEVAGRVAAVQVDLRAGTAEFCFKTAFDERLRVHSPGALLESAVVEAFAADPALTLLDSCAVPGHAMAERLFPDRRALDRLFLPLTRGGGAVARGLPAAQRLGRTLRQAGRAARG